MQSRLTILYRTVIAEWDSNPKPFNRKTKSLDQAMLHLKLSNFD